MKKLTMLLALCAAACTQQSSDTNGGGGSDQPIPPKVQKAATIANAIEAAPPEKTEAILAEHEMTVESFRALMFEIAEDESLTAAFERARKR